ncbi:hypothetical protein HAX54_035942 [Datura stramonium]|uniref:Uncharacterized protein n=1 Tax=Datura stramonium TaxID=4076 RepID=A0ABS8SFY8_DATST|nr:hypothetical protein [Datura stramonium]
MQMVLSSNIVIYGEFDGEISDGVVVAAVIDASFDFLVGSVVAEERGDVKKEELGLDLSSAPEIETMAYTSILMRRLTLLRSSPDITFISNIRYFMVMNYFLAEERGDVKKEEFGLRE